MKLTDALLVEHAVFYAQFTECEGALFDDDLPSLQRRAAMIECALAPHARLEDDLLFRTLETRVDVPPAMLMVMRHEHAAIESGLSEIQSTRDLARARNLIGEVLENARSHFAKEERVLFPLAEQMLSSADQARLAMQWAESRGVYVGS